MPSFDELKPILDRLDNQSLHLGNKEIRELPNILGKHEFPDAIVQGIYQNGRGILVCTSSRLIFIDKGIIYGLKVEDFPLNSISSIQYETGMLFGKISIFTSGNRADINQVDKKQARIFADFVRSKISHISSQHINSLEPLQCSNSTNEKKDSMDFTIEKLERLAALKERGVLTDNEFLTQKEKILNC